MWPSQLAFIINLAFKFKVTHLLECGRMGALPLVHYAHFGFNVTSFELSPQPVVSSTLSALVPSVQLIDGDCVKGIPLFIEHLERSDPAARVAIVLDGPKGWGVFNIANKLAEKAVFIVVDDQSPEILKHKNNRNNEQPRWPYLDVGGEHWSSWMPIRNMITALNAGEDEMPILPNGESKAKMRIHFKSTDPLSNPYNHQPVYGKPPQQMIMLGGRWRQGAP